MKKLLLAALMLAIASPAFAISCSYSWEDCGTVLALYGSGTPPMIVGTYMEPYGPTPVDGLWALRVEDNSPSGTPQAYVAWITGCLEGDVITGSFWRYDVTPGGSPSSRIWAHYADDVDINSYYGSASGQSDYGPGLGWDQATYTWTFPAATVPPGGTALIIECRTYSNPGDVVYIDLLEVSVEPYHNQCIYFPLPGPSATETTTWGGIKELYR